MCEVIKVGNSTAIICRGNHAIGVPDHKCDDKAAVYGLRNGERIFIKDEDGGKAYYDANYQDILSASVACSICRHAAIDDAPYL